MTIPGKKDRLIFDGSFALHPHSGYVNKWTCKHNEPPLVFPAALTNHLRRIYNLRITYPNEEILLWDDDVSSAFRWVKLNPDIAAVFAFTVGNYLFVPTGQTFGSNTSPSNWEVLARARMALGVHILSNRRNELPRLRKKYASYLKLLKIAPQRDTPITPAYSDAINHGVLVNNEPVPTEMHMHVDDNLMTDTTTRIQDAIVASIASNFEVLGEPNPSVRKVSLAEDKFTKTELSSARPQLGILIDTRSLTVSITDDKRAKLIKLLSQFGPHRKAFHLKELAELTGVLNFLAYCSTWSTFCYVRIQEALVQSCVKLYTKFSKDPRYKHLFEKSHGQTPPSFLEQIPFLLKEKATLIWRSKEKIALSHEARQQIKDITTILEQPTRYTWSRPIGSIIPRVCDWSQAGDASLTAGGGWCHHYQFWFHIEWPQHIRHETLMFKSPPTISINDLEFATAIILIAASCLAWETDSMQGRRPQPRISHLIDNTAGQAWLTKPCTTSPQAKRLTSVLCSIYLIIHL